MTDQQCAIEFLSEALVSVREEMKSLVSDLNLNEEAKEAIKVMQSGILAILDLVELDGDDLSGGGPPTSHFFAASPASTVSPPAPTATAKTTTREKNAAEFRSKLKKVHRLANRGKTREARAALAKIPNGKKLQSRSIEIAAKEMEDLLLQRGGLGTVIRHPTSHSFVFLSGKCAFFWYLSISEHGKRKKNAEKCKECEPG